MAKKTVPAAVLSGEQLAVIDALLAGHSQAEAAKLAGVAAETVSRWVRGAPAFVAELNRRRRDVWQSQAQRLRGLAGRAIDTLDSMLDSESEAMRFRAACAVLRSLGLGELGKPEGPFSENDVAIGMFVGSL